MLTTHLLSFLLSFTIGNTNNEPCSMNIVYKQLTSEQIQVNFKNGTIEFNPSETEKHFDIDPFSTYCQLKDENGIGIHYLRLLTTANNAVKKGNCSLIKRTEFKAEDPDGNVFFIKIIH